LRKIIINKLKSKRNVKEKKRGSTHVTLNRLVAYFFLFHGTSTKIHAHRLCVLKVCDHEMGRRMVAEDVNGSESKYMKSGNENNWRVKRE